MQRMQFGRESEKLDQQIEQLELHLEDLEAEEAVPETAAPVDVAPCADTYRRSSRESCRRLPALELRRQTVRLNSASQRCGTYHLV